MNKGYPRSRFEIVDQTAVQEIPQNAVGNTVPLAMATYTSDKGTEEWRLIYDLNQFTKETGAISWTKHGQPQLTVAEELRAGAAVFCKRLVSDDAKLANVTLRAKVVKANSVCYVYYYTTSNNAVTKFSEAVAAIEANFDPAQVDYTAATIDVPLLTVTPKGRGVSAMSFSIVPNYVNAKSSSYLRYSFDVYEYQERIESISFTMNPDITIDGTSQALNPKVKALSTQIQCQLYENGIYALVKYLASTATMPPPDGSQGAMPIGVSDLINLDFINGKDRRGVTAIGGIVTKAASSASSDPWNSNKPEAIATAIVDVSDASAVTLINGTNGAMGASPITNTTEYTVMLKAAFGADDRANSAGTSSTSPNYDSVIYDLDRNKIDFICDCAYPTAVKNAIMNLVDFREDMVFIADLGIDVNTISTAIDRVHYLQTSRFTSIYGNTANVYDPYTGKEIKVTMPYLLAPLLVQHIANGVGRPFAGIRHGITFPEIIPGTVNFIPVEVPGYDQKQELVDANINYVSLYDGVPVMETTYVNTDTYSQLNYLQNIMLVQAMVKEIRDYCPRVRYSFLDGSDLQKYLDDANYIINKYNSYFEEIEMQYMADEVYEENNIFYATIKVRFHNFVQEEYFKVIAVS